MIFYFHHSGIINKPGRTVCKCVGTKIKFPSEKVCPNIEYLNIKEEGKMLSSRQKNLLISSLNGIFRKVFSNAVT